MCSPSAQARAAHGLAAAPGIVAVACADATVRLFAARSLEYLGTLPRVLAHGTGSSGCDGGGGSEATEPACPDALGCSFSACGQRLAVVYSDRSAVVWDVSEPSKVRSRAHSTGGS